jgi:hypothetical protein
MKPDQPKKEKERREFKLLQAGGSTTGAVELAHGVILEQCSLGCSTYRVQRVHRYLKTTCDDESGGAS